MGLEVNAQAPTMSRGGGMLSLLPLLVAGLFPKEWEHSGTSACRAEQAQYVMAMGILPRFPRFPLGRMRKKEARRTWHEGIAVKRDAFRGPRPEGFALHKPLPISMRQINQDVTRSLTIA